MTNRCVDLTEPHKLDHFVGKDDTETFTVHLWSCEASWGHNIVFQLLWLQTQVFLFVLASTFIDIMYSLAANPNLKISIIYVLITNNRLNYNVRMKGVTCIDECTGNFHLYLQLPSVSQILLAVSAQSFGVQPTTSLYWDWFCGSDQKLSKKKVNIWLKFTSYTPNET